MSMLPDADAAGPPYVGALLRLSLQRVRGEMRAAVQAAGFTDLQDAHWAIFTYPLPDGVRPSELARRTGASRQAINHLIGQLESLGYLERRGTGEASRRLVHMTPRGREVAGVILDCLRRLHRDWAAEIGQERFAELLSVLRRIAAPELPPTAR